MLHLYIMREDGLKAGSAVFNCMKSVQAPHNGVVPFVSRGSDNGTLELPGVLKIDCGLAPTWLHKVCVCVCAALLPNVLNE